MKAVYNMDHSEAPETSREATLRQQIETRAYYVWLASGGGQGDELRHWLQAQSEVLRAAAQAQPERSETPNRRHQPKQRVTPAANEPVHRK